MATSLEHSQRSWCNALEIQLQRSVVLVDGRAHNGAGSGRGGGGDGGQRSIQQQQQSTNRAALAGGGDTTRRRRDGAATTGHLGRARGNSCTLRGGTSGWMGWRPTTSLETSKEEGLRPSQAPLENEYRHHAGHNHLPPSA